MPETKNLAWHQDAVERRWRGPLILAWVQCHQWRHDDGAHAQWTLGAPDGETGWRRGRRRSDVDPGWRTTERTFDMAHRSLALEDLTDAQRELLRTILGAEFFPPKPEDVE